MNWILPVAGTLGIGGLLGWAAATFLKTTTKIIGCAVGLVFILMQVLAYYGIAEWHWDLIAKAMGPAAAVAKHGAGALWKILTYNLPFTGGFAAGFWFGWRH
jgi:uncharacterized membrane protein (Fun14 family)